MEKKELSSSQLRAIISILETNSIEDASRKARISKGTIYNWLKDRNFKDRLERERDAVYKEGLDSLKGATAKAAKTLIALLDHKESKEQRLAAKEIIGFVIKIAEIRELEERVAILEERLSHTHRRY